MLLDFDVRLFRWRKRYGLWTQILVKNVLMLDLFQFLSSQDVNWWTGVVWIIVMFYQLDSHSDGTHSLQNIHCWDTDGMTHFYKFDEETNSSSMAWGCSTFSANFHFCVNCSFKKSRQSLQNAWFGVGSNQFWC